METTAALKPFAASGSGTKRRLNNNKAFRESYKKKMKVRWENERLVDELDHENALLRQKIFKLGNRPSRFAGIVARSWLSTTRYDAILTCCVWLYNL